MRNLSGFHTMPRILLLTLLLASPAAFAEPAAAPSPERQQQLVHLVRQDCGSCHGMTLRGGLGPPLTPEALREKSAESLVATIYVGRPGTPMPPWHRFLSEAEAEWIVAQLLAGFPTE
ncbi:MAG: cytochrome c [Candidatus Accumulibacter sp.]|nr:cytochrome c [Accumulibacter sp.]